MQEQPLGALATELIHAFRFVDGRPQLSEPDTVRWAVRLAGDIADPQSVARDLIAFAVRLSVEHPQIATDAVGTLVGLAAIALADLDQAQAAFAAHGGALNSAAAARAIGVATSLLPVNARGSVAGAVSPVQARFPTKAR